MYLSIILTATGAVLGPLIITLVPHHYGVLFSLRCSGALHCGIDSILLASDLNLDQL